MKENKLEEKGQHHVHRPHQGHGPGLLILQRLSEEGLASDAQNSNKHQHPAISTTEREIPLAQDGCGDNALKKADDGVVPHGEVVMDALPHFSQNDKSESSCNCTYKKKGFEYKSERK